MKTGNSVKKQTAIRFDELPLNDGFIEQLKETEKGRFIKVEYLDELFED